MGGLELAGFRFTLSLTLSKLHLPGTKHSRHPGADSLERECRRSARISLPRDAENVDSPLDTETPSLTWLSRWQVQRQQGAHPTPTSPARTSSGKDVLWHSRPTCPHTGARG